MLVLTRKIGESIRIGDNIVVKVLGSEGFQVKVGVMAPKDLPVHREEVYIQIQNENKSAMESQPMKSDMLQQFLQGRK